MSSDNISNYVFSFEADGPLSQFVKLKLFNGFDDLVAEAYGKITVNIPKGLYKLNIEFNEQIIQRTYRVDKDITDSWLAAGTYSSIPDQQLLSSHEYYSYTAEMWSKKSTVGITEEVRNSSLFVFLRYPNKEVKDKQVEAATSMGEYFSLLDSTRKEIYTFDDHFIEEDHEVGWLAFNAPLSKGVYFLVYNGPLKREMPLYVFEQWQTQVFITFNLTPVFKSTRILLSRPWNGYQVLERDNLELDAMVQKMHNGIYYVPQNLIDRVADVKWENPMLGIIVCYAYLLSDRKDNDVLFDIIVDNIQHRILNDTNAPDILALNLLAAIHKKQVIPDSPLAYPCMLLAGMKAYMEQSFKQPHLIAPGSIVEQSLSKMMFDCVWTTYEPLAVTKGIGDPVPPPMPAMEEQIIKAAAPPPPVKSPDMATNWITASLFNKLITEEPIVGGINSIAEQYRITPNIVKENLAQISASPGALMDMITKLAGNDTIQINKTTKMVTENINKLMKGGE
ncbi:hypothetical protein [Chitinophaga sp. MM2321]|uniref:hypothetical protein n=1 Tax=Chitinophaga sp. MM2321 TaxID=3137178 RepID=UPI0032D58B8C